jgi:serine/threonine-protein kinase
LLGRGGMGAVYRADHVHIKKSFALKVLHPELTHQDEAVKRFEREAIAAARIAHPNVATAIDFGNLPSGEFFIVLDYVQGKSLRVLLQREGQLSEARTVRICRQIAAGLAAAHAANVVHRDLKPDNVMLVESSTDTDFVKVLDFGIAKLRTEDVADEPAITRFGTIFGTPEYMSPEQALGQNVDARSDLYSLGIMMYEMLAGVTPFADEQLVTVLTRQMTDVPAPNFPQSSCSCWKSAPTNGPPLRNSSSNNLTVFPLRGRSRCPKERHQANAWRFSRIRTLSLRRTPTLNAS